VAKSSETKKEFQVPEGSATPLVSPVQPSPQPAAAPNTVEVDWLDLDEVEVQYRHQLDAGIWITDPARGALTGMAKRIFQKACRDAKLGTERPEEMAVVLSKDRSKLYFILGLKHKDMVDLTYYKYEVRVNLIKVFTKLKRVLPPGLHEFYALEMAEEQVLVNGKAYSAMVMPLKAIERRWEKSETEKDKAEIKALEKRLEKERKAAARQARKAAAKGALPAGGSAATEGGAIAGAGPKPDGGTPEQSA